MKRCFLLIITFGLALFSYAQNCDKAQRQIDEAKSQITDNPTEKSIQKLRNTLEKLVEKYPDCANCTYNLGLFYYNEGVDSLAIKYYEKCINLDKDYNLNAYYFLGKLYKASKQYEASRQMFTYYLEHQQNKRYNDRREDCKKEVKQIDFILYNLANPVDFNPVNLGSDINDTNYQYLPVLTLDEQLYFTQRQDNKESFYSCRRQNPQSSGKLAWEKKKRLPSPPNSNQNTGAGSISPDGQTMYFAICGAEDGFGSCDIYMSKREGNTWSKPQNLGPRVNSSAWDSQPSIASDGRTLFFASNRKGGFGGSDLYYTYLKEDGTWTTPKNLGQAINTPLDEISPFIHPSNTTLYFASNGLMGMGGMDIFYSRIEEGKFTEPQNIGYPINTEGDQTCLVVSPDATYAVFASNNLADFHGNMDLYAFELYPEARPQSVLCMSGIVLFDDHKQGVRARLTVKNLSTNKVAAQTWSTAEDGRFLMTIPKGEQYALSIEAEGYMFYSQNFSTDKDDQVKGVEDTITLQAIKVGQTEQLHNIFFETNSSTLLPSSIAELTTLLAMLQHNPSICIEISGHTDNVGSEEYNLKLSEQRALSVKQWLIQQGVDEARLQSKGYGMRKPRASNDTPEGRTLNRRTEITIISIAK